MLIRITFKRFKKYYFSYVCCETPIIVCEICQIISVILYLIKISLNEACEDFVVLGNAVRLLIPVDYKIIGILICDNCYKTNEDSPSTILDNRFFITTSKFGFI
ncbi:hypothetical protein JM81_3234 [Maribacter sp. MAR_2009_72]|nr:hypothetical protein JM81_3234 [Maribacter sp. MAR_2009_72]